MILSRKECLRGEFLSRVTLEDLNICHLDLDTLALTLHLLIFDLLHSLDFWPLNPRCMCNWIRRKYQLTKCIRTQTQKNTVSNFLSFLFSSFFFFP